ncbi:MAG: hypothetical protein HOQ12_09115 [Gemmatimonadaceae bacterium]|nr:hypothetical protein [Gemmatimonadaceae bacterium]
MPRTTTPGPLANKGSQRWLQLAVNRAPQTIDVPLREAVGADGNASVTWISPLAGQGYQEYRDQGFVDQLDLKLEKSLGDFWPLRGPMWDGPARVGEARVLVEAKAHMVEMMSGDSRASEKSKMQIEEALQAVRQELAPRNTLQWSLWNGPFYQYANRLAHLHFLRGNAKADVHLVYIYFLNAPGVDTVRTVEEWRGAIKLIDAYMGLGRHRLQQYVHKIFVDVKDIEGAAQHS